MTLGVSGSRASVGIRRCAATDAPAVAELARRLFVQAYGPTHPEPELSRYLARSFAPEWIAGELGKLTVAVLVAEDRTGTAIGYAHLQLTTGAPPLGVRGERPVEVVRFYVDGDHHGRGVAQHLMDACEAEATRWGGDVLWLAVWREAPRPQAFYRKAGFEVVGETTFRFGERVDRDFVMARPTRAGRGGHVTR